MRHVPQGTTWHPVNDNLLGTGSYGNQNDDTNAWSIPWSIEEFDEFLFSSGDKKYWLVVSKEELIGADGGKLYADSPITVIASSSSCEPYQAKMYKRTIFGDDPWVSIQNHFPIEDNQMVYGEISSAEHNQILGAHGGMDVFIRKMKGYSGTVTKNNLISTIDTWGPEYRVAISIIVRSAAPGWSTILRFTSTNDNCCNIGDRIPAIFYNSDGFLQISSAVSGNGDYSDRPNIDLNKWYHIEITQEKKNGKIYYTVNVNGEEISNVENTTPQSFEDVKVFAGDNFHLASDVTYKNLVWESNGNK